MVSENHYLVEREDGSIVCFASRLEPSVVSELFRDACDSEGYTIEDKIARIPDATIINRKFIKVEGVGDAVF